MEQLIGGTREELDFLQVMVRAIIIFVVAMVCIRISGMRAFAKNSALDVVVHIIIGSILARTIAGNVPFLPSIAGALVFALTHRILASVAVRNDWVSNFLKGKAYLLVKDGEMIPKNMRACNITRGDLLEGIRLNGHTNAIEDVQEAYFERNGQISTILKKDASG